MHVTGTVSVDRKRVTLTVPHLHLSQPAFS